MGAPRLQRAVGLCVLGLLRRAHEELLVRLGLLERLDQHVHGAFGAVRVREDAAHGPDERRLLRLQQQILLAGADATGSMAGKMRRSARLRSSLSSMLPVPLNSSKMTSSIFEPVSTS